MAGDEILKRLDALAAGQEKLTAGFGSVREELDAVRGGLKDVRAEQKALAAGQDSLFESHERLTAAIKQGARASSEKGNSLLEAIHAVHSEVKGHRGRIEELERAMKIS